MRKVLILLIAVCLAPLLTNAQTVTRIGSVATMDIGAWNIKQFQNADPQMGNVVATMQQSGVDIWGLQEVTSPTVLNALLARLGDEWDGRLATTTNLYTAFVFKKDVISVRSVGPMFTGGQFSYEFAGRPPLVMKADVTLSDTTVTVLFVTVHMKCCSDGTSHDRRSGASSALYNRLDFLHGSDRVIVMGDFNDETDRSITSGRSSPYANFVADPEYEFLIADGNVGTWCGSNSSCRTGSTIDNILISSELSGAVVANSADRFSELLNDLPGYVSSTSDHLPVVARFNFASSTAVADQPSASAGLQAWPSPARDILSVDAQMPGTLEIWDLLGRRVKSLDVSGGTTAIAIGDLPEGLYLLRQATRAGIASRLVVISR
ncbi:MAG: endonuclease/exonuclease/phosphatase family metal-dependent hydrolase [Rhodothermales bacterium]|jgi:endonuclease/exonuclease/phosphatase family metal-dependent hydrolase